VVLDVVKFSADTDAGNLGVGYVYASLLFHYPMKNALLLGAHFAATYAAVHLLHPEHFDGIDPRVPLKIAAVVTGLHVLTTALAGKVAGR
jgi:hypothetical protein